MQFVIVVLTDHTHLLFLHVYYRHIEDVHVEVY